jgi:hypothetical protein
VLVSAIASLDFNCSRYHKPATLAKRRYLFSFSEIGGFELIVR